MTRKHMNSTQSTLEVPKDLSHLPGTVAALVPLYRSCIVRFDAAVRARDFETTAAIHSEAHEIIERALSLDRFRLGRKASGFRYCFYDVAHIFGRLTRAAPNTVPLFGQQGDFVASLSIVRVRFQTSSLSADLGMGAYRARSWGFQIRAAEPERGFYTDTGYRSFLCSSLEVGQRTDDVKLWCFGHVRHWWKTEGGKPSKFALHRIRGYQPTASEQPAKPAPTVNEQPTGSPIHGLQLTMF